MLNLAKINALIESNGHTFKPRYHKPENLVVFRPQKQNDFPCNETNKEKLRRAVINRHQKNDLSSETDWVQLLFEFRSLVFLVGWADEQAWTLFDEICQQSDMGKYNYDKNRARWDVNDFKLDGKTYKSLLAELSKHTSEPEDIAPEDQKGSKPKSFKLLTIRDVLNQKRLSWLIKELLPALGIGALYGPSGSGKSFLVIDLLMALCLGIDWFGYKINKKHTVVYLALEGGGGIKNRIAAYLKHNAITEPDNFFTIIDAFDIRREAGDLIEAIRELNPSVVVIDTLNQSAAGCDENSNVDMSLIVARAKLISDAIKGLVLLVHHTGKDASKGLRGHSSLNAALDIAIEVQNETHKTPRLFKISKSKDGACSDGTAFKLKNIDLGTDADGDAISSCIVERDTVKVFEKLPVGKNQLAAWDILKNQLPINYSTAKSKVQDWLIQENPSRKRPDNTAKDAIDGLHLQGFFTLKDNCLVRV